MELYEYVVLAVLCIIKALVLTPPQGTLQIEKYLMPQANRNI